MGNRESLDKFIAETVAEAEHMNDKEKAAATRKILEKAQDIVIDFVNPYSNREAPILAAALLATYYSIVKNMDATDMAMTMGTYNLMTRNFDTEQRPYHGQANE